MKNAIVVTSNGTVIAVYTNLKRLWNEIDSDDKQSYSTAALSLSVYKPYDLSRCVIQGQYFQSIRIQKLEVNCVRRI